MVDSSSWKKAGLGKLVSEVELSRNNGKYIFIHDKQGNVPTFFQYKGKLIEFAKCKMQVTMGSITKEEALDELRRSVVFAQKNGELLCIFLDKISADWKGEWKDDAIFNGDKVFDFPLWRDNEKEIWKPYVKDDENSGPGGMNPGHMMSQKDFSIAICTQCADEDLAETIAGIPHFDLMDKLIIE